MRRAAHRIAKVGSVLPQLPALKYRQKINQLLNYTGRNQQCLGVKTENPSHNPIVIIPNILEVRIMPLIFIISYSTFP